MVSESVVEVDTLFSYANLVDIKLKFGKGISCYLYIGHFKVLLLFVNDLVTEIPISLLIQPYNRPRIVQVKNKLPFKS